MKQLTTLLFLALTAIPCAHAQKMPTFDKLPIQRELPNPLLMADGKHYAKNLKQWGKRRKEIAGPRSGSAVRRRVRQRSRHRKDHAEDPGAERKRNIIAQDQNQAAGQDQRRQNQQHRGKRREFRVPFLQHLGEPAVEGVPSIFFGQFGDGFRFI